MWNTILGISSLVVMPASFIFLVYATGYSILTWNGHLFVIALVIFVIALIAHVALGILAE